MGNRVWSARLQALLGICVFAVIIAAFFVSFASASSRGEHIADRATARLCAIQERLGARLPRPIINPEICNPTPEPTLTFVASPTTIEEGNESTLSWSTTNATTCTASQGWSGAKSVSGTEEVSPETTATYTLTCLGVGGSVAKSVEVTVTAAPVAPTLTLTKSVVNDNGGSAIESNFQAKINGNNVPWGIAQTVTAGAHTVSEVTLPGYTASSWSGDCAADGTITLEAGDVKTCLITNNDEPGTLHVVKVVTNENGGTKTAADFSFQLNGGTAVAFEADGQNDLSVSAGTYTITEPTVEGYSTTYENCTSVAIANGGSETCTITNNDIAVTPTTGHLIVDKVTDPSGDTSEFSITASGNGVITGGGAGVVTDTTSKDYEVTAGTYSVTEAAKDGWTIISNTCTDIVVAAGATETCTIINAKLPTLTLAKTVTNNNGGTAVENDFQAKIDGNNVVWGSAQTLSIGAHTASETTLAGYTASSWEGDCAADGTITLAAGDVKTCSITNDDVPPNANHLVLSEVYYDVDATHGAETTNEWIEIFNPTELPIDVSHWSVADAATFDDAVGSDIFPGETIIAAGGHLIVVNAASTPSFWSFPVDVPVVVLGSAIGGGLNDGGDALYLRNTATSTVDALSWGTNVDIFAPPVPDFAAGHSLVRTNPNVDTDTAGDWADNATPSPGL